MAEGTVWTGEDFGKIPLKVLRRKREGRKNSKAIGDDTERMCQQYFKEKGFVSIRVPAPKKKSNAYFQQKGEFSKWDVLVVVKGIVIQCKRRQKYMTRSEIDILKKQCKAFPSTELDAMLMWREKGPRFRDL